MPSIFIWWLAYRLEQYWYWNLLLFFEKKLDPTNSIFPSGLAPNSTKTIASGLAQIHNAHKHKAVVFSATQIWLILFLCYPTAAGSSLAEERRQDVLILFNYITGSASISRLRLIPRTDVTRMKRHPPPLQEKWWRSHSQECLPSVCVRHATEPPLSLVFLK